MSTGQATQQPDLQWLDLTDFSPGIQQKVMTPGVVQPSPGGQGAASITNTFRCIALPTGGLGPLPQRTRQINLTMAPSANPHIVTNAFIPTGVFPFIHAQADTNVEYVNIFISHDTITGTPVVPPKPNFATQPAAWTHYLDVIDTTLGNQVNLKTYNYAAPASAPQYGQPVYFTSSRCNPTSSPNTGENLMPGIPIVVASFWSPDNTNPVYAYSYPNAIDPYNATRWTKYDFNAGASGYVPPAIGGHTHTYNIPGFLVNYDAYDILAGGNGICLGHQNRIVFFPENAEPCFGSGSSPQSEHLYHNEIAVYTGPNDYRQDGIEQWSGAGTVDGSPGTITGTSYGVVFGQEVPNGVGCVQSLTSTDLLIIKNNVGAYLVQGDLNAATVRRMPSVVGTGGIRVVGTPSNYGFIYGVQHGGVYAWQGGDGSQSISSQLEEDFWMTPNSVLYMNQYRGTFNTWGDWVITPNNWLYDGKGWWRIEDSSIAAWHVWQKNAQTNVLYGARDYIPANVTNPPVIDVWDKTQPATSYSWQSHPMGALIDRLMSVRKIILVVQGTGVVTITQTDPSVPAPTVDTLELPPQASAGPVVLRRETYFRGPSVTVQIQADSQSTKPAPIVYQLQLGYDEGQEVAPV